MTYAESTIKAHDAAQYARAMRKLYRNAIRQARVARLLGMRTLAAESMHDAFFFRARMFMYDARARAWGAMR